ncbi:MAG TPA: class I SAM-dependent methyltransferase [Candidatus Eisenbacteria bacterium]|nr:class I SAM-dependent methyltransferase [Candidatus Eisenbacteria bacterium]
MAGAACRRGAKFAAEAEAITIRLKIGALWMAPAAEWIPMESPNDKKKIIEHYDAVSPYYQELWGNHIHHGLWVRGNETKEEAQDLLIEHLAGLARISKGARILDIGCGFGGTSLYLCRQFGVAATGITISPVQVKMANEAAERQRADARFCLMDAEAMTFAEPFDVLWSMESISHYQDREKFFAEAAKLLKPGGMFALTDWFKRPGLSATEEKKYIAPIDEGMFVRLADMDAYEDWLRASGLEIVCREDLTKQCARSWDLALDIIAAPKFWALAAKLGRDFVKNLKSFRAMRAGFASGAFVYGLFVARRADRPAAEQSFIPSGAKVHLPEPAKAGPKGSAS